MKKLLLVTAALLVANIGFTQSSLQAKPSNQLTFSPAQTEVAEYISKPTVHNPYGKSTGLSDTLYRVGAAQYDSLFGNAGKFYYLGSAPLDSGLVFGTNAQNWNGFAGRFVFNSLPDTTMKVIGVLAVFGGTVQPGTTKSIDFKVWGLDTNSYTITTTRKIKNLPGTALGTMNRMINTIGIGNTSPDTIKEYYFPTAISNISTNFFVGYEMNYQWAALAGDSIGAYSCTIGQGWGHGQGTIVGTDTVFNAQTAIKDAGTWKDSYVQIGFDRVNMSIVPIFQYSGTNVWPSKVGGVTKNNLTFYGNYPNPATQSTNIKFSLANKTSVNVYVRDITGKTVMTVPAQNYATGEHIISLETANLAAGNYVYVISTSEGDAMAAQFSVAK